MMIYTEYLLYRFGEADGDETQRRSSVWVQYSKMKCVGRWGSGWMDIYTEYIFTIGSILNDAERE